MFYFWNVDALVRDLRAGIVTEYEKMKYLLATSLLQLYALSFVTNFTPTNRIEILVNALMFGVEVGIFVWGIYHCYIINKHNDNKNFIERFICLGFPVGIRLSIYFLAGILLGFLVIVFAVALFTGLPQTISAASNVVVNVSPSQKIQIAAIIQKAGLLRLHVFNFILSSVFSILFFIILGRKIAAVGASEIKK
jgi:hypothetical protein